MSSTRVYVGKVPYRARERDLEDFFRGYGRVRDVVLKNGFGFVSFDDARDADDAVYETNGKSLLGERVVVEHTRSRGRGRGGGFGGGGFGGGYGGGYGGYDRRPPPMDSRYGPPTQTRHRLRVENLSSKISWQDLKDLMRGSGAEVTYADAHKSRKNEGVCCFASRSDLERALDKYQGYEVEGRDLKLIDDTRESRSRSRSRSPRRRSRSRSRSRSRRRTRSRSRSKSAGGSKSPESGRSRSGSADKTTKRKRSGSASPAGSKSPTANETKKRRSSGGSDADDGEKKKEASRSPSREASVEAPNEAAPVTEENGKDD